MGIYPGTLFRSASAWAKLRDTLGDAPTSFFHVLTWHSMFYFALILVAIVSRFLPHPPNVACMGAVGLFAGCYLSGWKAWLAPITVLLASDLMGQAFNFPGVGFYRPITMLAVYAAATLAVPVGRMIGQSQGGALRFAGKVFGGSLIASTLFFLLSNLGVWAGGFYSMTGEGLVACFAAAIPFYGYTLIGDLAFSGLLFGSYAAVKSGQFQSELAQAH